jgi:hypothetical protein
MPYLDGGDIARAQDNARKNVAALLPLVDRGADVVVPQPTCSYVLKKEYPHLVPGEATDRVAARTHDPFEFLALRQREGAQATDFSGRGPGRVAYHVPCHLRAQNIGYKTRDVLQLIPGTTVGDTLTFLFENRETVLLQIQEMIRTERIVDEDKTGEELATSNALVPDAGELSATLFIEIANIARMSTEQMRAAVNRFQGLEAAVRLEAGGSPAASRAATPGKRRWRASSSSASRCRRRRGERSGSRRSPRGWWSIIRITRPPPTCRRRCEQLVRDLG